MILLFGSLNDEVTAYLTLRMLERHARFIQIEPADHQQGFELDWGIRDGALHGELRHGERRIPLESVRSVYARNIHRPPAKDGEGVRAAPKIDPAWILHDFVESAPILVCNRFSACATNFSKPYQQRVIAAHGFRTPLTLTTSFPDEARDFYRHCQGRVIFKSISSVRSIVRRMCDEDLDRLPQIEHCPVQFQEWVPGVDIRVHVVGQRLFATEVDTDATDYRYAGQQGKSRTMRDVKLPPGIEERCFRLTASLGLVVAGVDLRRGLDGEYYCFEANPSPGFTFYEQYSGQRIGDAIVDLLECGLAA